MSQSDEALAKPASPAGGDVLRQAADIVERLPWHNAETIAHRMREAALSPSTSAAEPVEQYRWRDYGTDNWSPWFEGPLPQDCEVETRTLYATPPAPAAVDGQRVKVRDWLAVARAAGQHGVRYRTNRALEAFLSEIRACLATEEQADV